VTEAQVVRLMRRHLETQFPLDCPRCGRRYATLRDFLLDTRPAGPPIPHDAEAGDWNPARPLGTMTHANCACGDTLTLSSHGMPLARLWRLLDWARAETQRRGTTPRELLEHLRTVISAQVLSERPPDGA